MHPLALHIANVTELTKQELDLIISSGKLKALKKNQSLLSPGDVNNFDYFVLQGCLRQYLVDEEGKEHIVQFALADWWIGDWYSILSRTPSSYHIEALTPSEVMQFEYDTLQRLFDEVPRLERYFRIIFQKGFAMQQRRITWMQLPAKERYEEFLKAYRHFEGIIPQAHVASYLGLTRESINRIRGQRKT